MPIYQYQCKITGEIKEEILSLSNANLQEIICPIHCRAFVEETKDSFKTNVKLAHPLHYAERIWSLPAYPSHGKPTVIFKNNKTGETEVALYENQQAPHGFVKEELKTPHERSRFEKEQNQKQYVEDEYKTEERRFAVDYTRKQRHDDLKSKMSTITSKADNPAAAEALLNAAMMRNRNKKVSRKQTDIKLAVNHVDQSNLDKG